MRKLWILIFLGACTRPAAEVPSDFNGGELAARATALHKIVLPEDVALLAGVEAGKIGIHYEDYSPTPGQHSVQYHWPTGNIVSLPGGHAIDEYHSLGIAFVEAMTADEFRSRYGSNAGLQKRVDQLGKDSTLNADAITAEAKYLAGYAQSRKLEGLSGVGEAAWWETPVQALHVFADGVAFTVTVNVGENESANRTKAVEMVRMILDHPGLKSGTKEVNSLRNYASPGTHYSLLISTP